MSGWSSSVSSPLYGVGDAYTGQSPFDAYNATQLDLVKDFAIILLESNIMHHTGKHGVLL